MYEDTRKFSTLTALELRELLEELPDDALVVFSSDYGDYCHTEQAHTMRGELTPARLRMSAYSRSGWAVIDPERDGDDEVDDDAPEVHVIQ